MSGFIPERVLEEIRFRNDIVEVIGAHVPLKRSGSTYKACCPFHREKTPSFNVNPNMQIFKCFGCGEGGDVIAFIMKHQGLDFVSAARLLAERAGVEIEISDDQGERGHLKQLYAIHHGIAQFYRRCLDQYPAAGPAREYLAARGLDGEAAERFQIGYAPPGWGNTVKWGEKHGYAPDLLEAAGLVLRSSRPERRDVVYDRFRDRLMFPVQDSQGRVIAFSARLIKDQPRQPKYVNSPETAIFSKGRVLYGLDKARRHMVNSPSREALVCEGQIDVVRCHVCGFETAVAAQGTAFTEEHVRLLRNYADGVVLALDADDAGCAAAIKTARLCMQAGLVVRIAQLPAGEDPDSFLRTQGAEAFRERLEVAGSAVTFQLAVMGGREADSRGIAATARLARAALETIRCAPQAVQRERLLQEAAAALGVPQKALEADLTSLEMSRGNAQGPGSRPQGREGGTPALVAAPGFPADADVPLPDVPPPGISDGGAEWEPPPDVVNRLRAGAARQAGKPSVEAGVVEAEEETLCEHLVQGADDPDLMDQVSNYLPPDLLSNPLCRGLVEWLLDIRRAGDSPAEALLNTTRAVEGVLLHDYAESLRSRPVRVKPGGDSTRLNAVRDLILTFWRRRLQRERERLLNAPEHQGGAASAQRRRQLALDLKSLRQWDAGQDVILIEMAMERDPPGGPPAASEDRP